MKTFLSTVALTTAMLSAYADNITWGYYNGTDLDNLPCLGYGQAGQYDIAMRVSGDGVLGGAVIEALRLPVASKANMSNVSVWVSDIDLEPLCEVAVDASSLHNGSFNEIVLTEPVTIPSEGVMVGATFTITKATSDVDKYPIYFDPSVTDVLEGLFLMEGRVWKDYTSQFGAYAMQVVLSNVQLSDASATFGTLGSMYTTPNTLYEVPVTVSSDGAVDINNIEYVVDFNGQQETRTADVYVPAGIACKGSFKMELTGPETNGEYPIRLAITKVNGVDNEKVDVVTEGTVVNVSRIVERHTVVEEFTGTGCGYCPRGLQGMANLREAFGDRFIGIGIHQYNSDDPMYNKNYASLGFTGAPQCTIDRKELMDPYAGTSNNILEDFERYNAEFAPVDVVLTATWQEGTNFEGDDVKVDLVANTTALIQGKYGIAFVLTADQLTSTEKAWKQSNYYSSNSASSLPEDLQKFGRGGEYGSSSFYYPFDDVLISSSYNKTTNQIPSLGTLQADESTETAYTLSLPNTNASLLNAIKASIDKVFGIAIVLDAKGKVANAAKVRVVSADEAGIMAIEKDEAATATARYTLDGKRATEAQKGFSIVRMSDGSVRKELH